ncbi:hypothetical protein BGX30_006008 [Mortierella sp. GBA39]|nr:hypothetical protein BGX30_006008 [Mortierella sp. GBA39]
MNLTFIPSKHESPSDRRWRPLELLKEEEGEASLSSGIPDDASCKFDKDTIYECSAEGATPKPGKKCSAGLCSSSDRMSTTSVPTCKPDCICKTNKDTCGIDFPADCKFPKDTLYTCAKISDTPKQKEVYALDGCKTGTNKCYIDPCTSKAVGEICEDGPFCGNELPCPGLNPDLYYNCGKGMKPFPFDRCKNGKPTAGKCLCNDGNSKCGKNFDPKCKYVPGSTYTCSGKGSTPVEGKPCRSAELCDSVMGVGKCFGECKCKPYEPVCGAAFPESCKFKPGSLYQCDFGGADPARPTACQIPCNPQHGSDINRMK